jgi:hypothetical protein
MELREEGIVLDAENKALKVEGQCMKQVVPGNETMDYIWSRSFVNLRQSSTCPMTKVGVDPS